MHTQGACARIHRWALCIYTYMDMDVYRDGPFIGMGEGPAGPMVTVRGGRRSHTVHVLSASTSISRKFQTLPLTPCMHRLLLCITRDGV